MSMSYQIISNVHDFGNHTAAFSVDIPREVAVLLSLVVASGFLALHRYLRG